MNLVILIGLVMIGIAHAARGIRRMFAADAAAATGGRRDAILPAAGLVLSLVGLLIGWSAGLPLPIGYAGGAGGVSLDPLGCVFLLLLFVVATACDADGGAGDARDLRVAALVLTFVAGDAFLLSCGAILALLVPARLVGRGNARLGVLAAFAVAGACTLLSGLAVPAGDLLADPGFALLRAGGGIAPGSVAAATLPVLVVLAMVPLLGLWPARSGFRRQCAFAPVWVPVTGMLLGLFLPVRLLLDLAGPVPSAGWGALLMLLGAGSALLAGVSSLGDRRACGAIGSVLAVQNALAVVAVGVCLLARANDLPALAGSALDVVMLIAPGACLGGLACLSLARAMEAEAGSGLLARLGGLVRSMPLACGLMLVPMALLVAVPPGCGFAAVWLLLHAILAAPLPLPGGVAIPGLMLLLAVAMATALGCCGLLRLCWIAALGRPRTPRGAAATDLPPARLRRDALVLALPLLVGLFPGAWLGLAAGPTGTVAAGGEGPHHPPLFLVSPGGTGVLAPLPIALLLALAAVLALLLARRLPVLEERRQQGWEGGAASPPPWLPFGDPATQIAPATLPLALQQAVAPLLPFPRLLLAGGRARRWAPDAARLRNGLRAGRHGSGQVRALLLRHGPLLAALVLALLLLYVIAAGAIDPGMTAR